MTENKKRYFVFAVQLAAAAMLVIIDQLIKKAVVSGIKGKDDILLIKNVIYLTYTENTGAAFSAFSNSTMLLSYVTLAMLIAGVVYLFFAKIKSKIINISAAMILGGGAGNLIDRFAQGYVVDYIGTAFIDFPVYNFADILITVGVALLCVYLIYDIMKEDKRKKQPKEENADGNS